MIGIQQGAQVEPTPELRAAIQDDLHRWHVRTVIVGPMYNQAAMVQFFTSLLGTDPQRVDGVYVWWDVMS